MIRDFGYVTSPAHVALDMPGYFVWDSAVIEAEGQFHLFCSRWPQKLGFGCNWVFNSEIVHCVSLRPEGPYEFKRVVLPRRGREFFDGMNTHNTCIRRHNGRFYLYYMGTTYGGPIPTETAPANGDRYLETWNRKRIGLAVADSINGQFVRRDTPLLSPRDPSHWDCTVTTNPSVVIRPDGSTFMIYKSRSFSGAPLKLGIAFATSPEGPFERLSEDPVLNFSDPNIHIEDPFLWYDEERKKFCLIAKDDVKNGTKGITGEWGAGFYAESDDCLSFEPSPEPKVYSRTLEFASGERLTLGNLERPSLIFDGKGRPTHIFCAAGFGRPYDFSQRTNIVCIPLKAR